MTAKITEGDPSRYVGGYEVSIFLRHQTVEGLGKSTFA